MEISAKLLQISPEENRTDIVQAWLKLSNLWARVQYLLLTTNMHAQLTGDHEVTVFNSELLTLGEGRLRPDAEGYFSSQAISTMVETSTDLWQAVFGDIELNCRDLDYLGPRAIVETKNITVHAFKQHFLDIISREKHIFKSIGWILNPDDPAEYRVEVLNSLAPALLLSHIPILSIQDLVPPIQGTSTTILWITSLSLSEIGEFSFHRCIYFLQVTL